MNIIGETSIMVTNQAQTVNWTDYGLKLYIPKGALPAGLEKCRLLIKVGLPDHLKIPENTSLVSAAYWLESEPQCTFCQHLTLEIQHSVKPIYSPRLRFVQAEYSPIHLTYEFKVVEKGVFPSDSAYGCVQLNHFCLWGIVCNLVGLACGLLSEVQQYRANLYYTNRGTNLRDIDFVITRNLDVLIQVSSKPVCFYSLVINFTCFILLKVVQQTYTESGATTDGCDIGMPVEFASNSISLPNEIILKERWKIVSSFAPVVRKLLCTLSIKTGDQAYNS